MFQGRVQPPFSKQTKGYKLIAVGLGKISLIMEYLGKTSCCFLNFCTFPFTAASWLQPDVGYLARWSWFTMDALFIFTLLRVSLLKSMYFSLFFVFPSAQQPAVNNSTAEVQLNFIQANQIQVTHTCLAHKHTSGLN